jgi:hypothetical protein
MKIHTLIILTVPGRFDPSINQNCLLTIMHAVVPGLWAGAGGDRDRREGPGHRRDDGVRDGGGQEEGHRRGGRARPAHQVPRRLQQAVMGRSIGMGMMERAQLACIHSSCKWSRSRHLLFIISRSIEQSSVSSPPALVSP